MSTLVNPEYADLKATAARFKEQYAANKPFPNIYFDHFFDEAFLSSVLEEFPDLEKEKDQIYYKNPNEDKYASKGDQSFGPRTKELVTYLNSEPFRAFLQELTGIERPLIADPDFEGGGFHEIKPGGYLKLHVDFHTHRRTGYSRRLNFLVYLNKDWDDSYGGHFELWERDMSKQVAKVAPLFNRVAMFSTTGDSWHGHPDPLTCPPDRRRRSLALYYYTDGRPEHELKSFQNNRVTTEFVGREGLDSPAMKRYNRAVNVANNILPKGLVRFVKQFRNK